MRKSKRSILIVLTIALLVAPGQTGLASQKNSDLNNVQLSPNVINKICELIRTIEPVKETYGIHGELNELVVGNAIHAYECIRDDVQEVLYFYPLYQNGKLVLLVIDSLDGKYQITSGLVDRLSMYDLNHCAILYDHNACYYYNGYTYERLSYFSDKVGYRSSIEDVELNSASIDLCEKVTPVSIVKKSWNSLQKSSTTTVCYVSFVPQAPYSQFCWVASIACICNYLTGSNYNTAGMAVALMGPSFSNIPMDAYNVSWYMQNTLSLQYYLQSTGISPSAIQHNLYMQYPIYGHFTYSSGAHAATIYHHESINNMISVMDPEYGAVSVNYSGGTYSYISPVKGVTLTLSQWVSHYSY